MRAVKAKAIRRLAREQNPMGYQRPYDGGDFRINPRRQAINKLKRQYSTGVSVPRG